ncbi:hypothetical protein [Pseudonocardia thermophila]|nr:hypothetical protein [Pseudonocardia thermophila]
MTPPRVHGELAAIHAADRAREQSERLRAARVVAQHSLNAAECAETLAMLGLTVPEPRGGSGQQ